jgi:hypothetical protein
VAPTEAMVDQFGRGRGGQALVLVEQRQGGRSGVRDMRDFWLELLAGCKSCLGATGVTL